jgi:hypothetical protein
MSWWLSAEFPGMNVLRAAMALVALVSYASADAVASAGIGSPEPSTLVLVVVAGAAVLLTRKMR